MPRKTLKVALGILVVGFLLSVSTLPVSKAQAPGTMTATLVVQVHVNPTYDIYGSGSSEVDLTVNASSFSLANETTVNIHSQVPLSVTTSSASEAGFTRPVSYSFKGKVSGLYTYEFVIPSNATSLLIAAQSFEGGEGFLWRYVTGVPIIYASSPQIAIFNQGPVLVAPSGSILSQLYDLKGGSLTPPGPSGPSNQPSYPMPISGAIAVLQSVYFLPGSIAITAATLAVLVLVALDLLPSGRGALLSITSRTRSLWHGAGRPRITLGRLRGILRPRTLLVLFILISLVMVAGGALGGPAPRRTAYIMAATTSVSAIQNGLRPVAGDVQVVTPAQDFTDFAVMSSVGQFQIVVISNLPPAQLAEDSGFILAGLGNVPVIVIDNSTSPTFANQVAGLYSGSVVRVHDASNLTGSDLNGIAFLLSQNTRSNLLGLAISPGEFNALAAGEAALSMVLVFVGWAYLGSLAAKPESWRDLEHIATVIGAGVFVFVYSEAIYVATSSLLAFPIALHAVNSGAKITAISLLGFGGGSTPRLAAGFLGVIVGLVGTEGGLSVRKSDFALVTAVALVLVANPFSIGQFVFQGILLFFPLSSIGASTTQLGSAYASSLSLKGFIYGVGSALGGGVTPQYLLSAGKILFFAGLVPLAYLRNLGRTTTAIAVFVVAVIVGDGGVRVGEMTPDKTFGAMLPGVVLGFAFAAAILGLGLLERYVRGTWRSRN
ncbi:MAG: hypothetical protein JRM80_09735 [Nitrososphaerota archaeon]|nr:hypothetical protein [Nitrososphaerota archaeon]